MIDILDKKALESEFAEDFASPFFPMLAEVYLFEGDLPRARRVCEVGLDHDFYNIDGKFVYARVAMAEDKFTVAEKWFKRVVEENRAHFNGLRMLIVLEFQLNRSPNTIQNYINRLLQFLPHDTECKEWMNRLKISDKQKPLADEEDVPNPATSPDNTEIAPSPQKLEPVSKVTYDIEKSMATLTMVQVLKSQHHYNQALAVLEVLESMEQNSEKIVREKDEILRRISESQK